MDLDPTNDTKSLHTPHASSLYQPNIPYSITINPDDNHQYTDHTTNTRLQNMYKYIQEEILDAFYPYAEVTLYPEFSVPQYYDRHHYSRLHFHGIIIFHEPISFLENCTHRIPWARTEIDTISDMAIWTDYITKDHKLMEPYCRVKRLKYPLQSEVAKEDILEYPIAKVLKRRKKPST